MRAPVSAALLALVACGCASSPPVEEGRMQTVTFAEPFSPAEASGFTRTSRYAEVVDFLDAVETLGRGVPGGEVHVGAFGTSLEGRPLPIAVFGADDATPEAVRRSGKTRVLVVANIHAGEVAGKDAMLVLLRRVALGYYAHWADSLAVMVAPIYNADGNERFALDNRRLQDGPVEGMGQRPNAQGLDLNRDFTKLASPEARALVALVRDADPHVVVDLHTTNGTHMGYHLTYAPGLHPDTPEPIDRDLRDRWLPAISDSLLASDDFATWHYGNVPGAFGEEPRAPRGWYSFSAQPRFGTNYAGLRGRYAVLSEAYSYAPFRERVAVSRRFTEEVLDRVWAEASRVRARVEAADRRSAVGEAVAVRATWDALPEPAEVLLGEVDTLAHPVTGAAVFRRRDVRRAERMPAYVRFRPSETVTAPRAYVVTGAAVGPVRALLDGHGVAYEVRDLAAGRRERFAVDSVRVAGVPFQGVRQVEPFGAWVVAETSAEAGALVVPVGQPLGRLAVALLEPRSDDGAVAWGLVPGVADGRPVPIERIPAP